MIASPAVHPETTSTTRFDRPFGFWLGLVFVGALVLRLSTLEILGPRVTNDAQIYLQAAESIGTGGIGSFFAVPLDGRLLYTLSLVAMDVIAGEHLVWATALLQAVLGSITVVVIGHAALIATRSKRTAFVAAILAAVHVSFVFWGVYLLSDTLMLLLLAVSIDRLLALPTSAHPVRDSVLGLLFAIGAGLTRQLVAPFVLVLPLYAWIVMRHDGQRFRRVLLGFAAPIALAVVVLGASLLVGHRNSPGLRDRVNYLFWQGLYISLQWDETSRGTYGRDIRLPPWEDIRDGIVFYRTQSLGWIASDPGYLPGQIGRKLRTFWSPTLPEYSLSHQVMAALYFGAFFAASAIGLLRSRGTPLLTLTLLGVGAFTLASVLTLVDYDLRYRLPAELLLVPSAAIGVLWVADRVRVGRRSPNSAASIAPSQTTNTSRA
jgi:hypothetical protein